jgi:hypothetical protein
VAQIGHASRQVTFSARLRVHPVYQSRLFASSLDSLDLERTLMFSVAEIGQQSTPVAHFRQQRPSRGGKDSL